MDAVELCICHLLISWGSAVMSVNVTQFLLSHGSMHGSIVNALKRNVHLDAFSVV